MQLLSLNDLLSHFEIYLLAHKRAARNTVLAYCKDAARFLEFINSQGVALAAIHQKQIVDFLSTLHKNYRSPATISRYVAALRIFFAYIQEHHAIILDHLELTTPRLPKRLPIYCTQAELEQLLQACPQSNTSEHRRLRLIVTLLYTTGMRVSELVHIKVEDLYEDMRFVRVYGKGGKMRMIPLIDPVRTLVKEYIQLLSPVGPQVHRYLFPIKYGKTIKPISRQTVWSMLKKLAHAAGLTKNISPHTLRHTLATHSLQAGWDLRALQQLLGHEQLATVERYTHLETSHLRQAYNKKHPRSK